MGEPSRYSPNPFLPHPQPWKEENPAVHSAFPLTWLQGSISCWVSVCSSAKWDLQRAERRRPQWFLFCTELHRTEGILGS